MVFLFVEKIIDIFSNVLPQDVVEHKREPVMHAILGMAVGFIVGIICLMLSYSIAWSMLASIVIGVVKYGYDWFSYKHCPYAYRSDTNDILATVFGGVIAWVLLRLLSFII